ncbi:AraC family transcriptional regulator [Paenibacillus sp.]|uniref:AraC family transcriptional regulator n=1 Tax=Paenibacillus sp. TaxID=58172 RepID=UPI002D35B376|nr:AraC family transcriptional regulator [Paenibacillus sp.]HZG58750.1 AraC family transcriptional regulator [Paenibacillus sp.]
MKYHYSFEKDWFIRCEMHTVPEEKTPLHWHTALEIGCCVSGTGTFYFGNRTYEATPGDIFIVNPMDPHIAQSDKGEALTFIFLFFNPNVFAPGEEELLLPFMYRPGKTNNKIAADEPAAVSIRSLIEAAYAESTARRHAFRHFVRGYLLHICGTLLRHYESAGAERDPHALRMYRKIQPALEYIHANFLEPVSLNDVAALLDVSASRARHLFKEAVGEGYKEYLLRLRVAEAKRLLATTNEPVLDVCLRSGFQSISPFYRAFRLIVGMSPQHFRSSASASAIYEAR